MENLRAEVFAEEDAADGLGEDPDAGAEHEEGLDAGGEAFDLAVAVGVVGVGGAVGDLDGEEGDAGGDEVDAGVCGLGEHTERAGEEAGEEFEESDAKGGEDGEERCGTLGVVGGSGLLGRGRLVHGEMLHGTEMRSTGALIGFGGGAHRDEDRALCRRRRAWEWP